MDQRGARQPGHERRIFHGVPEPPAAPAQHVIGPRTSQQNAHGQECPRGQGPRTHPARPQRIQLARQQRRDRKGEGHGKAHVAHVQHRRMHDHAGVLQQRVQVAAGHGGRHQPFEGVGQEQQKQQQAHADPAHDRQHAPGESQRQVAAEDGDGQCPGGQQVQPQQQRPFVPAPHGGKAIGGGQVGVRVARHVQHRKVVIDERPGQATKRQRRQAELAHGGGARHAQARLPSGGRADQRQRRLRQRHQQRQDQTEQADLGNHRASGRKAWVAMLPAVPVGAAALPVTASAPPDAPAARLSASAASGGM
ncbi:hypothetical protein D3C85_509340 [compost metagenome]